MSSNTVSERAPLGRNTGLGWTARSFTLVWAIDLACALAGCTNDPGSAAGYLVRGTATGVASIGNGAASNAGVTLSNNGADLVHIAEDGEFYFPSELADGASYKVAVADLPMSTTCTLARQAGTIHGADAKDVALTCFSTYSVSGSVTGIDAEGLILEDGAGRALTLTHDGVFVFDQLENGSAYAITVSEQPDGQTCVVLPANVAIPKSAGGDGSSLTASGVGTIAGESVRGVTITCADDEPAAASSR